MEWYETMIVCVILCPIILIIIRMIVIKILEAFDFLSHMKTINTMLERTNRKDISELIETIEKERNRDDIIKNKMITFEQKVNLGRIDFTSNYYFNFSLPPKSIVSIVREGSHTAIVAKELYKIFEVK